VQKLVDFNNEATIQLDKKDINVLTLIEGHYYVIENIELYYKQQYTGMDDISRWALMSRIDSLYYLLRPSLKQFWKSQKTAHKLITIKEQIYSDKIEDKFKAFESMQDLLHEKGVLKFGKTKNIDTSLTEEEDRAKGL